jgi:hypothetical protein
MRNQQDKSTQWCQDARDLRGKIAEIFGAAPKETIILTPGTLMALQILLASLKIHRVALTSSEYYGRGHFPSLEIGTYRIDHFLDRIRSFKPKAVIASLVTWKGEVLPIESLFAEIRAVFGRQSPVLIADYSHAGAVGFPTFRSSEADFVVGDVSKWIAPVDCNRNLGFLWSRPGKLSSAAQRTFTPFFLATDGPSEERSARWIDPVELSKLLKWIKQKGTSRASLLERHKLNLSLALDIAHELKLSKKPASSILWIENNEVSPGNLLLKEIASKGLQWAPSTGGIRVLCRSEVFSTKRVSPLQG